MFAQTIVEAPKYGASRRTAAISAPSEPIPTTNTSSGRGGIAPRTLADGALGFRPAAELGSPAMDLVAADRAHLWHPFTQQRGWDEEEPLIVERAEGTELIDTEGRRYIDGVSSLWCNVHGHRHPAHRRRRARPARPRRPLDDARPQHRPAIELAQRLVELAPPGLTRVFYSDSGSTATEIALKMAFQYWQQRGERRARASSRCATPTTATRSARSRSAGIDLFHALYRPLLFDTLKAEPGERRRHGDACCESTGHSWRR